MSEDTAYKGYDIDKRTGQVVEFYDHRDKHPESNAKFLKNNLLSNTTRVTAKD